MQGRPTFSSSLEPPFFAVALYSTALRLCHVVDVWLFVLTPCRVPVDSLSNAAVGRTWSEAGRSEGGRRLPAGSGVDRLTRGGTLHRVPRFPPLADQVIFTFGLGLRLGLGLGLGLGMLGWSSVPSWCW